MNERRKPGVIRDAIVSVFQKEKRELSTTEIYSGVNELLGGEIAQSSVRSYLNINTPGQFIRTSHGKYRLVRR